MSTTPTSHSASDLPASKVPFVHPEKIDALRISPSHRKALHDLAENGLHLFSEDLQALCVYGSAARDEWDEKTSDINLLVVLKQITPALLEKLREFFEPYIQKIRLVPFVLSRLELRRSADVFSIQFDEMKRHHVCITGQNPLRELSISQRDLRFLCELELRQISMRLRQFAIQTPRYARLEERFLLHFFHTAMNPLRLLCGLLGHPQPKTHEDTVDVLQRALDTDVSVLRELQSIHRQGRHLSPRQLQPLFEQFQRLITAAVEQVDQLDSGSRGY